MPSEMEIAVMAQEYGLLLEFSFRFPIVRPQDYVERFLCYRHELAGGAGAQVLMYRQAHSNPLLPDIHSPLDEYAASSMAQQHRLLTEYASQFPLEAAPRLRRCLQKKYGLTDEDMELVAKFLAAQEAEWLEEGTEA